VGCSVSVARAIFDRNPELVLCLANKIALITAAGAGIGRAIPEAIAHEGCRVVATDLELFEARRARWTPCQVPLIWHFARLRFSPAPRNPPKRP
jgi:hypothetical protein